MSDFATVLYDTLIKASRDHGRVEVFDCGDHLEVEDLVHDVNLFTVTMRPGQGDQNWIFCKEVVEMVNNLDIALQPDEAEQALRTRVEEFVRFNEHYSVH